MIVVRITHTFVIMKGANLNVAKTKTIIFICALIIVLSFIVTTCILLKRAKHVRKVTAISISELMVSKESLRNLCEGMMELNLIDKDLIGGELVKLFPASYFNQDCYYVLCSREGCSSCLTYLIERIIGELSNTDDYYFLLEENNTYLTDEIKANGFKEVMCDDSFFNLVRFPKGESIILIKKKGERQLIIGYDIHIEQDIINHFLNL